MPTASSPWRLTGRPGSSSSAAPRASSSAPPEDKHGIRLSNTAALFLDDVIVPAANLVGGVEGRGLVQAQQVFGYTRLMVAAFGLGGGWEAMDRAIRYSTHGSKAGAPLSEKQGYTHKLIVPHVVRLEAARAFVEETATRIDAARARRSPQHRGGDREVPRHRGRSRRRGRRHPGARRLRLHPPLPGGEDPPRRPDHHHLRGHLRDHGDDHRARPVAAPPQDPRRALPRPGRELRPCTPRIPRSARTWQHSRFECLAGVLEACRVGRLTRNQHVLLRLGELDRARRGGRHPGTPRRRRRATDPCPTRPTAGSTPQAWPRSAACTPARPRSRWPRRACAGSPAPPTPAPPHACPPASPSTRVRAAQAGLLADMDAVADALYDRVTPDDA